MARPKPLGPEDRPKRPPRPKRPDRPKRPPRQDGNDDAKVPGES